MAEKTSELVTFNEPDAVSTAAGATQDVYLERTTDNDYSAETETSEASDETGQLKAQIEETRSQMGETIDAIQEKLSLQNISEQVKDQVSEQITNALETAKATVYDAVIGNIGKVGTIMQNIGNEISKSDLGKKARKNPFPLVLIGIGVGLLAYEGFGGKKRRSAYRNKNYNLKNTEDYRRQKSSKSLLDSATGTISDAAGNAYESVSGAASSAYGTVTDATGNAIQIVSGAASAAYGGVTDAASSAYSKAGDLAGTAYEKAGDYGTQAREKYDYHIEENPLAVGAVALALGAAVGLSIPSTRYESELLGEYRQQLIDKAQEAASGLVDKAKNAASQAQETISNEVKKSVTEAKQTFVDAGKDFDSAK